MLSKGKFITLEGVDGSGKSSLLPSLKEVIRKKLGVQVCCTFEPGGTEEGKLIRNILLDEKNKLGYDTELLLMLASRAQLYHRVIEPALVNGDWVLCDRFIDSTYAYQGWGRGIDIEKIKQFHDLILGDFQPDLTFYLDLDPAIGLMRIKNKVGRFEAESIEFHQRVRNGYQQRAKDFPDRIKSINATLNIAEVRSLAMHIMHKFIDETL